MRKNNIAFALLLLTVAMTGCGKSTEDAAPEKSKSTPGAPAKKGASLTVLTVPQKQFLTIEAVGAAQSTEALTLPGRVTFRPQAQSAVGATVAGRVVSQLVRAGEVVKAGTPVLVIESVDASAARATLDQTATRLTSAESVHRRNVEMAEKGVGLESERQEAESRVKEARAEHEHERARQAVALIGAGQGNRVTVRAPTNGVVRSIRVAVGATVAPGGEPLLELGDSSMLQVVAQVSESDARRLVVGQQAEVELPALAAKVDARVESLGARVDAESRRAQAYLSLAKRVDGMQAGMLAQITVRVGNERDSEISLPVSAVLIKDGKRRVVYVEKSGGKYEAREVQTGRNRDGRVIILKGVAAGERVVVRGALLLDTQAEQML